MYDEIAKKLRDFTDEKDPFYTIKLRDMVINLALDELDEGYFSVLNNKNYKVGRDHRWCHQMLTVDTGELFF